MFQPRYFCAPKFFWTLYFAILAKTLCRGLSKPANIVKPRFPLYTDYFAESIILYCGCHMQRPVTLSKDLSTKTTFPSLHRPFCGKYYFTAGAICTGMSIYCSCHTQKPVTLSKDLATKTTFSFSIQTISRNSHVPFTVNHNGCRLNQPANCTTYGPAY